VPAGGSEDFTRLRRAGNRALVRLTNVLYGCGFTDLCYGYCAFWRRHLPALRLVADGFEIEAELALRAVKAGLKVSEVASVELGRRAGSSNLNAFRDGRRVLRTILRQRLARTVPGATPRAKIELVPAELAAPGSSGWMPAGEDRRKWDRRVLDRAASGYTGPERRRADRRQRPPRTTTVYRAIERQSAPGGQRETGGVHVPEPVAGKSVLVGELVR
jgi:hypothetical protein